MRRQPLWVAGLLVLVLTACSPQISWPDQPSTAGPGTIALESGTTIGQTSLALEAGLSGVDVFLDPQGSPQGELRLALQAAPQTPGAGVDLATATLPLANVTGPGFYRLAFSPQSDSRLRAYYLRLSYDGPGQLLVGHGPPDSYPNGALYRNDGPDDGAQMAFRLVYDPLLVARGVAAEVATWLGWLTVAVLLFLIPGWALLVWLWPALNQLSLGEQLGLAAGLSVAVYPVLFLITGLVGWDLGWLYAILPAGLGLFALGIWLIRLGRGTWLRPDWRHLSTEHLAPDLTYAVLTGLIIFTRLWVARSLLAPLWGDSYQHTVITQLIIDHGGLFNSWAPYADLQSFTYHFGFHTLAAVWHWSTGLPTAEAVLWVGQILNVLAVLTLYPLATRVSGERWAGVGAVLVAGLLSFMPMVYVNWGRYTQLAGQTILAAAVVLAWAYFEHRPALSWRLLLLACLAWGGLALTHYRVLIFAVCFAIAFWIMEVLARRGKTQVVRTAWLGLGSGLIFLPWFVHTFAGQITTGFLKELTTPAAETPTALQQYNAAGALVSYLPTWLWLLMFLCLAWSLWRRERTIVLLSLWWAAILVSTNPQWLGLPGQGAITNFAALIAAYIPAGVLLGVGLAWLRQRALPLVRPGFRLDAVLAVILLVIGLWGAKQRLGDLQAQENALVTMPDIRAAAWVKAHTPPDARLLINSFAAYGATSIVGSDGGWWLPILANRQTNVPPLNYGVEVGPRPDYREWVNALTDEIQTKGIDDAGVIAELQRRGLNYVFLGQLRGAVNNPGVAAISAGQMVTSPRFHLVYHQDRVFIFQVLP